MAEMQEAYRALADPHRRTVLRVLRSGERTAGALAGETGLSPAALAHHLTVLKLADLVRVERRGQYQVYALNTTVFQDFVTELMSWLHPSPADGDQAPPSALGEP